MFDSNRSAQDELSPIEQRLRTWQPSTGGLDRDRMLFEAGRAAAQGDPTPVIGGRFWPLATAAAALLALGLGFAWQQERTQRQVLALAVARRGEVPTVPHQSGPEPIEPRPAPPVSVDPSSYMALTRQAVSRQPEAEPGGPGTSSTTNISVPTHDPLQPVPLRPRDLNRVIAL